MTTFVSKVIEIEAIQFTGDNGAEVAAFVDKTFNKTLNVRYPFEWAGNGDPIHNTAWQQLREHHGWGSDVVARIYDVLHNTWVGVKVGQWIIRGMKGEYYPCDDEVFRAKYEAPQATSVKSTHDSYPPLEEGKYRYLILLRSGREFVFESESKTSYNALSMLTVQRSIDLGGVIFLRFTPFGAEGEEEFFIRFDDISQFGPLS